MADIAELIALAKEWPDDTPWGVRIRELAAALAVQAREIERLHDELESSKYARHAGCIKRAEAAEARVRELETNIESLRLELNAEKHTHLKDNEYLLAERDAIEAKAREIAAAIRALHRG